MKKSKNSNNFVCGKVVFVSCNIAIKIDNEVFTIFIGPKVNYSNDSKSSAEFYI